MPVGDWQARLTLTEHGAVRVDYLDPQGAARSRLPRDVSAANRKAVAALKDRLADIDRALAEARRRLEQSYRDGRDWSIADWRARYADHPLTRTLAARLVWRFTPEGEDGFDALPHGDRLVGIDGESRPMPAGGRVRLWHPGDGPAEAAAAWRFFCLDRLIRQPFHQAWRPVYAPTDPERRTATYSNRFAGLILDQPVMVRVLRGRGWTLHSRMLDCVPKHFAPARLPLPTFGLTAEYWGSGAGRPEEVHEYGAPNFPYFASSQLRFYRTSELDRAERMPVPLDAVPGRAFTEALFDLELVTGIAAAGWVPDWIDPGSDAAPPPPERTSREALFDADMGGCSLDRLGQSRLEMLAWLLPRLAIGASCTLDGNWLRVRGKWQDYAIHCGNAAVRVTASNRHLCIVPAGRGSPPPGSDTLLPLFGDEMLSLILSKATLLADEQAIRDQDILRQLH